MRSAMWTAAILMILRAPAAGDGGVDLAALKGIRISADAHPRVAAAAEILKEHLADRYGLDLPIATGAGEAGEPGILLGRGPAVGSGMITDAALDAVKFDGYVIRAAGGRIAVAPYRPICITFATYTLLERLGLKRYSGGRGLPFAETFTPLPGRRLPAFTVADKPFFEYRSVLSWVSRGACGESYEDLGNPREAANPELFGREAQKNNWLPREWLGADHTAAYLVPKQLHYDEHPEYYALRGGKRLGKSTLMQRMALCLTHPDVHRIAAERMVEWMGLQADRRFFYCTNADARPCRCPRCRAADLLPYYTTDRYLAWVNGVAAAAGKAHPDKRLFALAYITTAKPPVRTAPAANVIVLYCPWFWTSVSTRTATFAHPKNLTGMEEITGWLIRCPKQVGIYDYPGHGAYQWMRGMVKRTKWYARKGLRTAYCCGTPLLWDGLFHHVMTRLLWDPLADSGDLTAEYVRAAFGKATAPMLELVRLNDRVWEESLGDPMRDPALVARYEALFREAEELAAAGDDPLVRQRVWKNTLIWLEAALAGTDPRKADAVSAEDVRRFRRRVLWFLATARADAAEHKRQRNPWMLRQRRKQLLATLKTLGIDPAALFGLADTPPADADVLTREVADADAIVRGIELRPGSKATPARVVTVVATDSPSTDGWQAASPLEDVAAPAPRAGRFAPPRPVSGPAGGGLRMELPLTALPVRRLPIHPDGRRDLHAGWFVLRKAFPDPIDCAGCDAFEIALDLSCDLPVSVCIATEGAGEVRSDIRAHAGRQVLRMDLDAHARGRWKRQKWTGRVTGVKLVFWPQDAFHPHPPVRDARATLRGIVARRGRPSPGDLPAAGEAVWLAQVRSNLEFDLPPGLAVRPPQGSDAAPTGTRERFRTWTERRVMTPIAAIRTPADATPAETKGAAAAREHFGKLCGVKLPVISAGPPIGPDTANVVLVGRRAALAAGLTDERELAYVGAGGFVLRAHNGRIALAGGSGPATLACLARYLEDHGVRFFEPGRREIVPDLAGRFVHELIDLDRPWFASRPVGGGWKLRATPDAARPEPPARTDRPDVASVRRLAAAIKDAARTGHTLPPGIAEAAGASALHAYVASRLLWDPFTDPSRLIPAFTGERRASAPAASCGVGMGAAEWRNRRVPPGAQGGTAAAIP